MTNSHPQALQPIEEVARYLQEMLGYRLTALIAGAPDSMFTAGVYELDVFRKWVFDSLRNQERTDRLRTAYQVFQTLLEYDSAGTVRSWFSGMNPYLNDSSPAEALREDKFRQVMSAANISAENG